MDIGNESAARYGLTAISRDIGTLMAVVLVATGVGVAVLWSVTAMSGYWVELSCIAASGLIAALLVTFLVFKLDQCGSAFGIPMGGGLLLYEITKLNRAFLRLVRRMLDADIEQVRSVLGIPVEIANALLALPDDDYMAVANTNLLLCRIRFDDRILVGLLENKRGLPLELVDQAPLHDGERSTLPAIDPC
ncbi:flagellar transcriptional regulator FlhD [Ralstonia nicotianae]|uniref:flagellar transcriptional regulator FlhD n=1 Tax=Ralstonia pseudosolanacearum TaxID=1310165 RepID=UPI002005AA58|nr:flagellar transcriptional regulator FlhD [Ralstonia pseudosolanacearum]MCK4118417.1 flagellar transcriptional regulator FlhD [Ralstonia pseudosolanacearum]